MRSVLVILLFSLSVSTAAAQVVRDSVQACVTAFSAQLAQLADGYDNGRVSMTLLLQDGSEWSATLPRQSSPTQIYRAAV